MRAYDLIVIGAGSGDMLFGPELDGLTSAMMLGQTVDQLGRDVLYVHPALTEAIEQALLEL